MLPLQGVELLVNNKFGQGHFSKELVLPSCMIVKLLAKLFSR
jgi:hypothetical protein